MSSYEGKRFQSNPDIVATSLPDEVVLLDPSTRDLFSLNATGQVIWDKLDAGFDAMVGHLLEVTDGSTADITADVGDLLGELLKNDLIREV